MCRVQDETKEEEHSIYDGTSFVDSAVIFTLNHSYPKALIVHEDAISSNAFNTDVARKMMLEEVGQNDIPLLCT